MNILRLTLLALGFFLVVLGHALDLGWTPGLHFDEAWAMTYAWRIASEPGFWPLTAMSPYTAPWAHYWAALWLKLLGPSQDVFRLSQASLSLGGLLLLCASLPRRARFLFPWAVLLLPGLVLNHRFAIELTGLHALCFGALCLALARRWWVAAFFAALAGTTAHVLFYGAMLALLAAAVVTRAPVLGEKRPRALFAAYFALTALFLGRVALLVPEKGKASLLALSALLAAAFLALGAYQWRGWHSKWGERALAVAAVVFLFNACFFGQGYWTASLYTGLDVWGLYPGLAPPNFVLCLLTILLLTVGALAYAPRFPRAWLLAGAFVTGVMMLKPAPRYYELALLGLAALFTLAAAAALEGVRWAGLKNPRELLRGSIRNWRKLLPVASAASLALIGFTGIEMSAGLFDVRRQVGLREAELRFLAFRDSSRDFLDKKGLVKFLGGSGCEFSDIETHDPRLLESLKALSLGDWPRPDGEKPACRYSYVARATEEGAKGEPFGEFVLKTSDAKNAEGRR